ncbi:MAG TPA: DUF72 domain-containing protein [Candidatus Binataceae bacterium]
MARAPAQIRIGTSGFSYKEWLGRFYPSDLKGPKMLAYYATRLKTVEINYTFRQMPRRELLERWASETPADFRFALKAPQRITHQARLRGVDDAVDRFATLAAAMGDRLGPVLFQLPPGLKRDLPLLSGFLAFAAEKMRLVFEFRDQSWFDDTVFEELRKHGAAFCIGETEHIPEPPLIRTAPLAYLRLRKDEYDGAALARWAARIRELARDGGEVSAYFRHGETAPDLAARLISLLEEPAAAEPARAPQKSK